MFPIKIAIQQMCSTHDPYANLLFVNDAVLESQIQNADMIFFPENVFYRGPKFSKNFSRNDICLSIGPNDELLETNSFSKTLKEFLHSWQIPVFLGSVFETGSNNSQKPYNSQVVWLPSSKRLISYRKVHLFDFQGTGGNSYRESEEVFSGSELKCVQTSLASVGLSICYDLRFPELFRALALTMGAQIICVPAAFTRETGRAHWHTLLRARAIENQCFVVAAAQWGSHQNSAGSELYCFGNSCVYDPWGNLLHSGEEVGDSLKLLDIDLQQINLVREKLPSFYGAKLFQSILSLNSQE